MKGHGDSVHSCLVWFSFEVEVFVCIVLFLLIFFSFLLEQKESEGDDQLHGLLFIVVYGGTSVPFSYILM